MGWILFVIVAVAALAALPWISERMRKPMDATARKAAPGKFAALPGGLTHYQWHGPQRGPVLVCVHGLATPSFVWGALLHGLTVMGFRVLSYDLYGRGFSGRPEGAQDSAFFLRQLEELLADQEVEDGIIMMGYSMGGAIATCYAAKHPLMLDRLVLLAPAGLSYRPTRLAEWMRKTPILGDWAMAVLGGVWLRHGIRAASRTPTDIPDFHTRQAGETRYRGFLSAVLSSTRHILARDLSAEHAALAKTDIPVLAIWGGEDRVIGLAGMGKLAALNRRARQSEIDKAPHSLAYSHPREVLAALQEFLREV